MYHTQSLSLDYGGEELDVCDVFKSFDNFVEDMGVRPWTVFLERIDVDGNYLGKCYVGDIS